MPDTTPSSDPALPERGAIRDVEESTSATTLVSTPMPNIPESGIHAWMVVAGASAGMTVPSGWCNCIGFSQAYYQENQLRKTRAQRCPGLHPWSVNVLLTASEKVRQD